MAGPANTPRRLVLRELQRLAEPAVAGATWTLARLHWWLFVLVLAYGFSGVTVVQPNEVALLVRFGRLVGQGAGAVRPPGVVFALPRPVDEVVRVPVARVFETEVRALHYTIDEDDGSGGRVTRYAATSKNTLDPEVTGYALTGDQNIVHVSMVARWQIADPVIWATAVADPEAQLTQAVLAAAVVNVGGRSVDAVLSEGRQAFVDSTRRDAQRRLDAVQVGVSIVSLELLDLAPPQQVKEAFREVQTAAIDAETRIKSAEEYREVQLPKARSDKNRAIQAAKSDALARLQVARSDAAAFLALEAEYRRDPHVVRERLYREGIGAVLKDARRVQFVPPPNQNAPPTLTIPVGRAGGRNE